jgi:hypothetical protein
MDKQSPARETLAIDVCRQLDEFQRVMNGGRRNG